MEELSIFIDESGDFGEYSPHSPYYIIGMVFHDQSVDLSNDINKLEHELSFIDAPSKYIHVGPIIRREEDYQFMDVPDRIKILKRLMTFFRKVPVKCKSFYIEKKQIDDEVQAIARLSKQISTFIKANYQFFLSVNSVKIYYDNGQIEVTKMLSSVFNALLDNVTFVKIIPSNYRLSQVADLVCTLKLVKLKLETKSLSSSELIIFESERVLKKQYLKHMDEKEFDGFLS